MVFLRAEPSSAPNTVLSVAAAAAVMMVVPFPLQQSSQWQRQQGRWLLVPRGQPLSPGSMGKANRPPTVSARFNMEFSDVPWLVPQTVFFPPALFLLKNLQRLLFCNLVLLSPASCLPWGLPLSMESFSNFAFL